jgi:transcriptional repressor NrdR
MQCPYCSVTDCRVLDSRLVSDGTVTWRRRACEGCQRRFTTYERIEYSLPGVVKKNGQRESFSREKLLHSLRVACNKRPVSVDALDEVAGQIERRLAEGGDREVSTRDIGQAVMDALKGLDEVAYVRFASVYKSFRDIDAFMTEMSALVRERPKEPV